MTVSVGLANSGAKFLMSNPDIVSKINRYLKGKWKVLLGH